MAFLNFRWNWHAVETSFIFNIFAIIMHCKEILHRLINNELGLSLERFGLCVVKNLNIVLCVHSNTLLFEVFFIKSFANTTIIVIHEPSILHELYCAWLEWGASLRPVIHHSHLNSGVFVSDSDSRIDWEVICRNFHVCFQIPCWTVVNFPFLHLKTIWICVENRIIVHV